MFFRKRNNVDALSVAAIRATVIDVTNKANSGHPGMAIGSAPLVYNLYKNHLKINPKNPNWIARDRFVLSAGHASALLYTTLHLAGYGVSIDDLKAFRQLNSITPGHPEYYMTPGVDATTGPLGQGLGNAVGMALAEASLVARFPKYTHLLSHYTYSLVGDGCLQEGISQEVISFAGHQKLNKLIVFYDANEVTLDGPLSDSFSENVEMRFKASEWNVLKIASGNNLRAIDKAIRKAKRSQKPTLIIMKTIIGQGSRQQGTHKVHGSPLGELDGTFAKGTYLYPNAPFEIPLPVYEGMRNAIAKNGGKAFEAWTKAYSALEEDSDVEATDLKLSLSDDTADILNKLNLKFEDELSEATRNTSGNVLAALNRHLPHVMGGSADVASSVMTSINGETNFTANNRVGRNINFGIREFGMGAISNGMLLHGGIRPYVGTFLIFSDYLKNSIRLAALSHIPNIYLFSHDSVHLGEDGPTHQPIEQLAMLRATPNLDVWRPADARETFVAWKTALLSKNRPTVLALSRQKLPIMPGSKSKDVEKGGYVVSAENKKKKLDFIIIATGSEVNMALRAQNALVLKGHNVRIVSMPSIEVFRRQEQSYKDEVLSLPKDKRIAVEILTSMGWHEWADHMMCLDRFGFSAPQKDILDHLKYTAETLARIVEGHIDPSTLKANETLYSGTDESKLPPVIPGLDEEAPEELLTVPEEFAEDFINDPEVTAEKTEDGEKDHQAKKKGKK
ncbi:MAG: transketolase [Bacilli bacterium]|nr:transketolase [Bacilli bacterium]